jgi:hypothetical protein
MSLYHLCIAPYSTGANCGGIQLISAIRSFHTGPFPTDTKKYDIAFFSKRIVYA